MRRIFTLLLTAAASDERLAVCITGAQRTLLETPVVSSFQSHVRVPLERKGARRRVEVFVVLSTGSEITREERAKIIRTYQATHFSTVSNASARIDAVPQCTRDAASVQKSGGSFASVATQWAAILECYRAVVAREENVGYRQRYDYIYQLRTDLVFFTDIFPPPPKDVVVVASGGMSRKPSFRCMNDHVFACPRHLCAPHFHQLDIVSRPWRGSVTCGETGPRCGAEVALRSLPASRIPFERPLRLKSCALPAPPPGLTAQWFRHALYGGDLTTCGVVRERDVYYAIARPQPKKKLECFLRLVHFWRPGLINGQAYRRTCEAVARSWWAEK